LTSFIEKAARHHYRSFGIALFPDEAEGPDSLIRAADEALYQAKGAGRDCIIIKTTDRFSPTRRGRRQVPAGRVRSVLG
jgi:predicted signal transduction protein with EAL and GGDEF domain